MLRIIRAARLAAPLENQIDRDVTVPTISVIIPARNEASRIRACLEAIVGASGVHEVIVVDDNSFDDTKYLLEKFLSVQFETDEKKSYYMVKKK